MKEMIKKFILVVLLIFVVAGVANADEIERKKNKKGKEEISLVIVGRDTVNAFIKERNWGRFDRGLNNHLFVPKGVFAFGLTFNFGTYDTKDMKVLSYVKDLDFKVRAFSIKPEVSYFFRHNQAVGLRFGFTKGDYNLNSLSVDFDDDINFNLKDVRYNSMSYSTSLFYRHYVGLDRSRRFAIFNEVDFQVVSGNSTFQRLYNDIPRITDTKNTQVRLNFSPGVCIFLHEHASFNLSFGIFGWYYTKENQRTDGVEEGTHSTSGANFRFNIFNLNMGIGIHF